MKFSWNSYVSTSYARVVCMDYAGVNPKLTRLIRSINITQQCEIYNNIKKCKKKMQLKIVFRSD